MKVFTNIIVLIVFYQFDLISGKQAIRNPVVNVTGLGSYEGSWKRSKWTMQRYANFEGIPYAEKTPRFQPPIPVNAHEGVLDVSSSRSDCLSIKDLSYLEYYNYYSESGCQYLSVFTKAFTGDTKKPVLVYVLGYDLEESEPIMNTENFLEEDVVVVFIQHRVGPFGFLSTQSGDIPGNAGILDVIEALRWIKKYIKEFGGDEENVTAFGNYKAAALIHLISMTSIFRQEKLFQKMILQSGSALLNGLATDEYLEISQQIGEYLQCKDVIDINLLNKCLNEASEMDLAEAYRKYRAENPGMPHFTIGGPSLLIESPIAEIAEYAEFNGVSVMGGVVQNPVVGLGEMKSLDSINFVRTAFIAGVIHSDEFKNYKDILEKKFPAEAFKDVFETALWPALVDLNSLDIKEATGKALKYISTSNITTFMYVFEYNGSNHWLPQADIDFPTVAMGDENTYLFPGDLNKKDKKMAKTMVKLWTSFATKSIPEAPSFIDEWPAVIKDEMGPYLKIKEVPEVGWNFPEEFFTTVLSSIHD